MNRFLSYLESALQLVAALCLAALALLTLTDVFGRYLLHFPVRGAVEMTEVLMVGVIFAGIVLATRARAHVAVDLLSLHLGARALWLQQCFSHLAATLISLLLALVSWEQALSALDFGDRTTMLGIPLAPVVFFMSTLLFLNTLVHLGHLVTAVQQRSREPQHG